MFAGENLPACSSFSFCWCCWPSGTWALSS